MHGKTALITGASRGIGLSMVRHFAKNGYKVYANFRSSDALILDLKKELPDSTIIPVYGDVTNEADVKALIQTASDANVLVNNAGIAEFKPFMDMDLESWETMLQANLTSMFLCTRALVPFMLERKEGSIVNISSVWGVTGGSCEVHYSAAKAGMIGFTKALAKELGPSNIRVNCIAPGVIETHMLSDLTEEDKSCLKEQTPLGTIGVPSQIASAALFLAEHQFITGEVLQVNGGFFI